MCFVLELSVFESEDTVESFARKYRPTGLADYIGNQRTKETVFNRLRNGKPPQQIMLNGTTGCGKTTMARILIREIMCENRGEILGACGECHNCTKLEDYILTGRTDDLIDVEEIDIASKSGKGDIEDLIADMVQYPMEFPYKVYLFDEVHMASDAAQTSLLKPVEEPPPHVILIFATTDPEKLKDTIRNRMALTLKVEKPSTKELVAHMAGICRNEGIDYDNEGLRMICTLSGNVIRAALNYLEQVTKNKVSAEHDQVAAEFDMVADDLMFEFIKAYQERDYASYIMHLYEVSEKMSLDTFHSSLSTFISRGVFIMNNVNVEGMSSKEIARYKKLFKEFTAADISVMLANLRKLKYGDILSNFMAFIYDEGDFAAPGVSPIPEIPAEPEKANDGAVAARARGRIDAAQREEAEASFVSSSTAVGEQDITALFGAKIVKEDRND